MNMLRVVSLLVAVFSFTQMLSALDVSDNSCTVRFVMGTAEIQDGSSWKKLAIGQTINTSGSIRLQADSSIELQSGKLVITIREKGSYKLADLIAGSQGRTDNKLPQNLADKIRTLTDGNKAQASHGGVRAEAMDSAKVFQNPRDLLISGVTTLLKADSTAAVNLLGEAWESRFDEHLAYTYYYSLALQQSGKADKALEVIKDAFTPLPEGNSYASDLNALFGEAPELRERCQVLKAELLFQTGRWTELDSFGKTLDASAKPTTRSAVLTLRSQAAGMKGNAALAKSLQEEASRQK